MITLPEGAHVPDQWVVEKDSTQRAIIVPASLFSENESHTIIHVYRTGVLLCNCKGWKADKPCFHVKALVWIVSHKSGSSGVQPTSIRAYLDLIEGGSIGENQGLVHRKMLEMGRASDKQIAKALGVPINEEVPRRNELTELGLVIEDGKVLNDTGRLAIAWKAIPI